MRDEGVGRLDRPSNELFLQLEESENRTSEVGRLQPNGLVEHLHCTLLDEHMRIQRRKTV